MAPGKQHGSVDETMTLLRDYDEYMSHIPHHQDLILVLGNTGAGKTTLTKLLTRLEDLEAYKQKFELLIKDSKDHKISEDSTVISKTIFPDLNLDQSADPPAAFYDLPGFCDTRTSALELANAYFTRDVTQSANKVKILLVVNHNSLRTGQYRKDMLDFLKQVAEVVPSPQKFSRAFCLVATKVEHKNEDLIPAMADFIAQMGTELSEVIQDPYDRANVKIIIDSILSKDDRDNYSRLGYVLRPTKPGKLSDSADFQEQLTSLREVIHNNCEFVQATPTDFGISVSAEGKMFVNSIAEQVFSQLTRSLVTLGKHLEVALRQKVKDAPAISVGNHFQELQSLKNYRDSMATAESRHVFFQHAQNVLKSVLPNFETGIPEVEDIGREEARLAFLEEVGGKLFQVFPLLDWLAPIDSSVTVFEKGVAELGKKFSSLLIQEIEDLGLAVIRSIPSDPKERKKSASMCKVAKTALEEASLRIRRSAKVNDVIKLLGQTATNLKVPSLNLKALAVDIAIENLGQDREVLITVWNQPLKNMCNALENRETTEFYRAELETREKKTEQLEQKMDELDRDKRIMAEKLEEKDRKTEVLAEKMEQKDREMNKLHEKLQQTDNENRDLKDRVNVLEKRPCVVM